MNAGVMVISLDFEIHWGVSDRRSIESYRENLESVPEVVLRLLDIFRENKIHCTWATVGMLFCKSKKELFSYVEDSKRPTYERSYVSNYVVAEKTGENESDDPFHFAPTLIRKIITTPGQEMASHTFSHYYCLEPGQTVEQFGADLLAAKQVAAAENIEVASIVFPANQFHPDYLQQCRQHGIKCYRGNYPSWIYQFQAKKKEGLFKRLSRLIDTYLPLMGARTVSAKMENGILNIPASCFLRPYSTKLFFLEWLRVWRIKYEMTKAAKRKKIYHLWWHPHNFGSNIGQNFKTLNAILDHYKSLEKKYGMKSQTMHEIYNDFIQTENPDKLKS
jgi:hypothetical protein